jgi:hypothetical protein
MFADNNLKLIEKNPKLAHHFSIPKQQNTKKNTKRNHIHQNPN